MRIWLCFLLSSACLAKPSALPIEKFSAHPMACRGCHEKQYDFWESTSHATAYVTLYAQGQHFDPECIGCHTLGFRHPGGFRKTKDTVRGKISVAQLFEGLARNEKKLPELKQKYLERVHSFEKEGKIEHLYQGVQCEHCHGLRGKHPGGEPSKRVALTTCRKCHIPDRSPHFAKDWLKKVACPRISAK